MTSFTGSIDAFHQAASDALGLDDFGVDDYREALSVLCRSLDHDASMTSVGEAAAEGMIIDALSARLCVEEGHRTNSHAGGLRIERPLVIVGLPRTGTTALHHLIAQDPGFQSLEHWLERTPKPRPPLSAWESDEDFLSAKERVRSIYERSPEMQAIHGIAADLPDECWNIFSQNFTHSSWQANFDVQGYADWWSEYDMTPTYRRHLRNAQLIGCREPDRRWLFKDSTHLFDLDALLAVYPDALIIQTHRDPVKTIPSVCSLCWSSRNPMNQDSDLRRFAESTLDLWERGIGSMMEAREGRDPAQFFDLSFERFVIDPIASIREIYEAFEIEYDAHVAMNNFRLANPKGQTGEHRYSSKEWGLDADEIAERFSEYYRRYDVVRE